MKIQTILNSKKIYTCHLVTLRTSKSRLKFNNDNRNITTVIFITKHEHGCGNAFGRVCLCVCPVHALTFVSLDFVFGIQVHLPNI